MASEAIASYAALPSTIEETVVLARSPHAPCSFELQTYPC